MDLRPEERPAFLDRECASDPSLRKDVDEMLSIEGKLDPGFLESPAAQHVEPTPSLLGNTTLPKGTRLGNYEVHALLGAGGMGQVYRARDLLLKRDVAIKVIPAYYSSAPDRLHRFKQEAEATAALNHPNILTIYQVGQHDGTFFIVAELLQGNTLRERLRAGAVPVRMAIDCGVQMARGLAAAHERGIVHRDLKPENIFVTRDGHIKILDFGLAKLIEQHPERRTKADDDKSTVTQVTQPGLALGTTAYMSPEQVRGDRVDHHSDIFAFGAVLYEMLIGRLTFAKGTSAETMTAILNEDPPALSQGGQNVPPGLQRVIQRCLEKQTDQRFQSASDLAFALEALSDSGSFTAAAGEKRRFSRRHWLVAAAVVVIVLAALFYAWWRIPPAVPVMESITQLTDDGKVKDDWASMDTDGSRVYFTEEHVGTLGLAQVAASGGPVAPVPTQIPAPYRATIAPDFSGLLVSENAYGPHSLWFQPLPAGDPRRLGSLEAQGAAFSPDGKKIVYTDGAAVKIADRDGANARKIADVSGVAYWPAVSPDGKKIRVTVQDASNYHSFWEMRLDGDGLHRLETVGNDFSDTAYGRWTPDGRYFVFQNSHEGRTDIWAIFENPRFLHKSRVAPIQITNGPLSCSLPTPSRDGKQIFARCAKLRGELVRYDRQSRQFVPSLGGLSATDVSYSRDGAWVVYLSYPDNSVWRMRSDGRDRMRLTYPPITAHNPNICPDGKTVAFVVWGQDSRAGIYILDLLRGVIQTFVPMANTGNPSWSPDGNSLAFDVELPGTHTFDMPNSTEIRVLDMASGKISVIPQSRGMSSPVWVNNDTLVATTDDAARARRYDLKSQAWSDLASGPFSDCNSTDGTYVYGTTMGPALPKAVRIRVSDGHLESLLDLSGLSRVVTYGAREVNLTPGGELLFTRDTGTQEIYALNIHWP
jgi:serine/threonine protein kinase/Tol biopolymer transport system component